MLITFNITGKKIIPNTIKLAKINKTLNQKYDIPLLPCSLQLFFIWKFFLKRASMKINEKILLMRANIKANSPTTATTNPKNPLLAFELSAITFPVVVLFISNFELGTLKFVLPMLPDNKDTNPNLHQYLKLKGKSKFFVFSIAGSMNSNEFHFI